MEKSNRIGESELVLNNDGTIYHLNVRPENIADTIILVGDPGRVDKISSHFDKVEFTGQNREIKTHTGTLNGKRLTVMSTGMGADNIDIVLNELDALVNIDFETRTIRKELKSLNLIRLGTSGGLQPDLPINAVVASEFALGLDGVLPFYLYDFNETEKAIQKAFVSFSKWKNHLPTPYIVAPRGGLIDLFEGENIYKGITMTAPGFYGPQGRKLRLPLTMTGLNDTLQDFRFNDFKIMNYEMETSALYGLSNLLGHRALTLCVAIANRKRKEYNQNYNEAIIKLIEFVLQKLTGSSN